LIASVRPLEIRIQAIRNLLNASAERGIVEHVHDRSVNIGNGHLGVMPPDRFDPENLFRL
jgi:hypothetical protein